VERLWAGWRMAYVAPEKVPGRRPRKGKAACLFCEMAAKRPGGKNLILAVTPLVLVMMNLYPYNVGHVMVAPHRHLASPEGMKPEEAVEVTSWLGRVIGAIRREYRPHGFNLGVNLGRVAGAGIVGHLHWHIVPRWNGDTNFMPVLADTKVLPEPIGRTYQRLRRALEGPGPRRRAR
jgi:ATP adenylyltransferase